MPQGQHRGHRFDAAAAAQQVTGHRLGRADRDLTGTLAKGGLDGRGLVRVVGGGAGAVRVDVVDRFRFQAGIPQGQPHRFGATDTARRGGGDVVGVTGHAVANHLGQDRRAPGFGVLQALQHQHTGALADHESIPFGVERAARRGGVVIAEREGLGAGEAGDPQRCDRRFGAAADHGVRQTHLDQSEGIADGVRAGGAGCCHGTARSLGADRDRRQARGHVRDHHRHAERAHPGRALVGQHMGLRFHHQQPTHAGADGRADAVSIALIDAQPGGSHGLLGRYHAELAEPIPTLGFLGLDVGGRIEVLHLSGKAAGVRRRIEQGDATHPVASLAQTFPVGSDVVADRCNRAEACDHDAVETLHHRLLRPFCSGCSRRRHPRWRCPQRPRRGSRCRRLLPGP